MSDHGAQAWQELTSAGLRVRAAGDRGRIRFPADRSVLASLAVGFAVLSAVVFGLGLLISVFWALTLAAAVLTVGTALALVKRHWWAPFDVTVDLGTGEVQIPPHGSVMVCYGHFDAGDVAGAGVDWARAHGSSAAAGAPIVYLWFDLRDPPPGPDIPALWMDRLDAVRARAFVLWFYRHVIPTADSLGIVDAWQIEQEG